MHDPWSSRKSRPQQRKPRWPAAGLLFALSLLMVSRAEAERRPYGLAPSRRPAAYLAMPDTESGPVPARLSQTGAFKEVSALTPADGLIPYELNVTFWSDGAAKTRWISVPAALDGKASSVAFTEKGAWGFPAGTVLVKHFDFALDELHPERRRRLETRLLVRDKNGSVYGVVYKWREDGSDADLLSTNLTEALAIRTATGVRTQGWYYPSRQDCKVCHNDPAGGVLGVNTRQLNGDCSYPGGVRDNQLRAWNHAGLFTPALDEEGLDALPRLADAQDESRSLEDRARSYLDANCAHCHRPAGTVAGFDARYETPLDQQNIVRGPVLIDQGIDDPHIISPNDIWRSIAFMRVADTDSIKMPPLAHARLDEKGLALLREWIQSMPGPKVLAPPSFSVRTNASAGVEVSLEHPEPGVIIRYTLDGSAPTSSDPPFERPIRLSDPTVVRAKAFKQGFRRSITAQRIFEPPR